jgi:hypothetical protein
LLGARPHELDVGGRMRALDPAAAVLRHLHAVLLDQGEDDVGGATRELDQALAALGAEHLDDLVGVVFQARDHLAAVATRGAPAGLARLQHQRANAPLGQVQRRRESGIAAADDADIGRRRLLERRRRRRGRGGRGPERGREREGLSHGGSTVPCLPLDGNGRAAHPERGLLPVERPKASRSSVHVRPVGLTSLRRPGAPWRPRCATAAPRGMPSARGRAAAAPTPRPRCARAASGSCGAARTVRS